MTSTDPGPSITTKQQSNGVHDDQVDTGLLKTIFVQKASVSFCEDDHVQQQVKQHQLKIHRQNSLRFSAYKNKNDLETKINRMYSYFLVKYHWAFMLLGVFICLVLTGVGFVKQPLPSFLDPKKGFGARGEGTLTSKLIVMKNINKELIKYQDYILNVYEKVKIADLPDFDKAPAGVGTFNDTYDYHYDDYASYDYKDDFKKDYKDEYKEDYEEDYEDDYEDDYSDNAKKKLRKRDVTEGSEPETIDIRFLNDLLLKDLTGNKILEMIPANFYLPTNSGVLNVSENWRYADQKHYAFDSLTHCDLTLGLNKNLEFYFKASDEAESYADQANEHYNKNLTSKAKKLDELFNDIDAEYSTHLDRFFRQGDSSSKTEQERQKSYILSKEKNLFNLKNLKSLCKWDKKMLRMLANQAVEKSGSTQPPCYVSLPSAIALINNKSDCEDLTASDVRNFINVCRQCYPLQKAGVLFWAAEDSKAKSDMDSLLTKNAAVSKFMRLPFIHENICFKKNLMHVVFEYLVDNQFLLPDKFKKASDEFDAEPYDDRTFTVKTSALIVINSHQMYTNETGHVIRDPNRLVYNSKFVFDFYIDNLNKQSFDDEVTELFGLNLMGVREEAAMRLISQEMTLVALAIILIVAATLLYLKSVVISMMINISVGLAIGVSFFIYRIVFDIELFPFLNMMAAFLLLGIACDDVFVLFDSWYNEKAKIIMEDLPEMIEKQYQTQSYEEHTLKNINGSQIVNAKPVEEYLLPPMFIERKFINTYNEDHNKSKASNTTSNKPNRSETNVTEQENFVRSSRTLSLRKNSGINIELQDAGISLDRLNDYMLNPGYVRVAVLTDEQMVRVMGGTLRHAASSIFVTSFTTAAAFLSNYITKIPYMQLFGVFTGTCIIVYFMMVITMISAFVVLFEKHIQLWRCKMRPGFTNSWERIFNGLMDRIALMNYCAISRNLPKFLIKFRFFWFFLFLSLGAYGMVAVFYYPKLTPPVNWRYQFFKDGNLMENFEFDIKDQYLSYVNEERRNLTNPEIFFVFGINGRDTGSIFDPDDDGYLEYDRHFDFLDPVSQQWINDFINISIANRPDLFMSEDIVREWNNYLISIQQLCWETLGLEPTKIFSQIFLPYERNGLSKCRDEINSFLQNSSVRNFETLMASFPRRIIFIAKGSEVTGILLRVNANRTFASYDIVKEYYDSVRQFQKESFKTAPKGFNSGWFISIGFALYDLQYQLISGTYSSLVFSMAIALVILLLTSGNIIISVIAIMTISFSIADTIAVFVFLGWKLDVLESVVIIMSVGLSVDFSCHYGVAYINADVRGLTDTTLNSIFEANVEPGQATNAANDTNREAYALKTYQKPTVAKNSSTSLKSTNKFTAFFKRFQANYKECDKERFIRVEDIFSRVGSAVLMAAVTTFLAGMSMFPSGLTSFSKMGQFLMLVMCTSYLYATFFFVPMCAIFGPTKNFGKLNLKKMFQRLFNKCKCMCGKKYSKQNSERELKTKMKFTIDEKQEVNLTNQTILTSS